MDKWSTAFTAIGGLAAIGGLIDLAMYNAEKAKLKAKLEDWWLRFVDVNWSNFGRAEAELAIQVLDSCVGPRLWSWKRWQISFVVPTWLYAASLVWTCHRAGIVHPASLDHRFNALGWLGVLLVLLPAVTISFALSLSLTRWIAKLVARFARGTIANVALTMLLLALHIVLLFYWSAAVFVLQMLPMLFATQFDSLTMGFVLGSSWLLFTSLLPTAQGGWLPLPDWSALYSFELKWERGISSLSYQAHKIAMDLVSNGIRILFALVFLSSFIFRPLIQEPISRLWYGAMNSGKPIFTMLFGAIGTAVASAQILTA